MIAGSANGTLCGIDQDWHAFEGGTGWILSATVTLPPDSEAGPVRLTLVDPDGATVLAESDDGDVFRQLFGPLATYFIVVSNPDSCGEGDYELTIQFF